MSAHFVNFIARYPKISHAFIRREVLARVRKDVRIDGIAPRGGGTEATPPQDVAERELTQYIDVETGRLRAISGAATVERTP